MGEKGIRGLDGWCKGKMKEGGEGCIEGGWGCLVDGVGKGMGV